MLYTYNVNDSVPPAISDGSKMEFILRLERGRYLERYSLDRLNPTGKWRSVVDPHCTNPFIEIEHYSEKSFEHEWVPEHAIIFRPVFKIFENTCC
jgi:hypothetical protein